MEKITLVCTSLNPDEVLLDKMVESAKGFDKKIISTDTGLLPIPDAYNKLIKTVETEWVCCFCDDDYFYPNGLFYMINEVHKGIDADVAHFDFHISGYCPKQDYRAWLLGKEYDLGEHQPITPKLLKRHNRLPAGSFFRKSAWERVGGFQGDKMHDWDLWKRMAKAGLKFKYFPYLVYNFVRRENSAWLRQNRKKEK